MPDEKLEQEMKDMTEKLRTRDEAERKKAEKEWRKAMERDTAGHMLAMFQYVQAALADLQAQLDAANPLAPIMRRLAGIEARMAALVAEIDAFTKKVRGEE